MLVLAAMVIRAINPTCTQVWRNPVTSPVLRRTAVAEMFGVCERTIMRWAESGFLDEVRVGPRSVRVTSESVDALLRNRTGHSDRPEETDHDLAGAASGCRSSRRGAA
jgi:predicted DNA-binding transcriptional regulator AlpA